MALSQAKITSFYRPTKSTSSAAAKRRKAVIDDPAQCITEESKTVEKTFVPDVVSLNLPNLPQPAGDCVIFSADAGKCVQPKTRRTKKTVSKSRECSKSAKIKAEVITEETTSVLDNHAYNPDHMSNTPKTVCGSTTSTRKRKMQCIDVKPEVEKTPEKVIQNEKEETKTPSKVRKKLEMEDCLEKNNSPIKQVQFLCLGTLSPKKPELVSSPLKCVKSPLAIAKVCEQGPSKSSAVRSLSSLLDKVPSKNNKLTSEEIKTRLGNSKNLAELQAKLSKVNNCSAKVKEFYANQVQLKKFSAIEFNVDVPVSPHKSPLKQSPVKQDRAVEKRPAFERFHALSQPPSAHLTLPYGYKVLNEVFRCLETVVAMLYNRKECIYFTKLKPAVQKMLQRDFTEMHLRQICYVFPSAYKIGYEKLVANLQTSPIKSRGFQLIVVPRVNYLSSKLLNEDESDDVNEDQKTFTPLGPAMLIERRYIFHNRLIKIVKEHHTEFLTEYNPLLKVPEDKVTRWHQNFDVDAVPDVPAAPLPAPPEIKTFVTAKDVLEQAHSLVKVNPRLEAALKERACLKDGAAPAKPEVAPEIEPIKPLTPANTGLKGVSQSLIDKIRAREAAKAQKQMTMNTEEIRKQGMSKALPELARIMNSIFVTEKKAVLPLRLLIERIQYSHRGIMSATSVEEHIKLLRTVYPEWIDIINRGSIDYVKVDRKIDSNIVYQKLEDNAKA